MGVVAEVEQVEVVKGPGGTLNSFRLTSGGAHFGACLVLPSEVALCNLVHHSQPRRSYCEKFHESVQEVEVMAAKKVHCLTNAEMMLKREPADRPHQHRTALLIVKVTHCEQRAVLTVLMN